MDREIHISDRISYLKASENPLSADVICVRGNSFMWVFDVGASDEAAAFLNGHTLPKKIVLSHFHPDHIKNIEKLSFDELFVSKNTFRYINKYISDGACVTIVDKDRTFSDGCDVHIFPLPSTHSKGSLGMEIDNEYAFLGDAAYYGKVDGKPGHNPSILYEELKVLSTLKADKYLLSHQDPIVKAREDMLKWLRAN